MAEVRKASLRLLDREYLSIRDNTKSEALKEMEMKSNARGRFNRATYIVQLGRDAFAQSELAAMEKQETKTAPAPSARVDSTDSGLSPEAQKKEEHDLLRSKLVTQICTFTTTDSTFSVIAGVLIKSARSVKLFHAIRHLQSQDTDTSTQFKKVALYKLYISLSEKDRERLVDATLATLQDEYRELQENAVKRKDRHSDDDTKIDQNLAVDPELLDAMHGIDIALPSLKRQLSEGVCTSMFIECLTDGCGASLCMRCDETIDACDINLHLCKYARKVELYRQLDEILATASSQRCPTCLTPGVKDLECTHIACSCDSAQGKTTWCYVCGENAASFGGHFRVHNDYSLTCYPEEKRCPMYLKYKYGSLFSDAREVLRTGDRAACLERFHLHRKLMASAKYKASLDASDQLLFDEMLLMSYPEGLFDVAKVKELRLILDYNTAKVLERREREEIYRRKQSGSVSPSTTNADAVNE